MAIAMFAVAGRLSAQASTPSQVPRAFDGHPDLSGIWQAVGTANWDLEKGVDAAAVPAQWVEFARRASNLTSLVVDPPNGRIPPLTEDSIPPLGRT